MNKYSYTILNNIKNVIGKDCEIDIETKISDTFSEKFIELDWAHTMLHLELTYGIDVPDELADNTELSILEFSKKLFDLNVVLDEHYLEYYELKTQMISDSFRQAEIHLGYSGGKREEIDELKARSKARAKRIKEIFEFSSDKN